MTITRWTGVAPGTRNGTGEGCDGDRKKNP